MKRILGAIALVCLYAVAAGAQQDVHRVEGYHAPETVSSPELPALAAKNGSGTVTVRREGFGLKAGHYILTHKALLATDALGWAAMAADLESSIHCQNVGRRFINPTDPSRTGCLETNPTMSAHPSPHAYWINGGSMEIALTAFRHLIWHYAPTPGGRYFGLAFITIPSVAVNVDDTLQNIDTANGFNANLAKARARVMRR